VSTEGRPAERVQSVRNAWINALRDETLRVHNREQARVAHVGQMIATYADADGGNAWPSRETLAVLCGCTTETVTRAVAVLTAVKLLTRKRRPNTPTAYQLLIPTQRPDWDAHMHLYTDTRQKRDYAKKKAREMEEHLARATFSDVPDSVHGRYPDSVRGGLPDSVHSGVSGQRPRTPSADSDSVHGRPRTASTDAIRTASTAGGTSTPTSGRDPYRDQNLPQLSQQPQVRAGARSENDQAAADPPQTQINFILCAICDEPMVPRPGRTAHRHCTTNAA
jgi:DNA-binding transcriptional regulator YhcF (GntR family)